MKAAFAMALFALTTSVARAEWKDIKPGMDQAAALHCVGLPLMQNKGRGGAEVWTYDCRGYIQFQYGRVAYWEQPKAPKPALPPAPVARATPATSSNKPAALHGVVAVRD